MRTWITLMCLLAPGSAALAAQTWKVDEEKRIYYAPDARLTIQLQSPEASEEIWDILFLSLSYEPTDAEAEVAKLKWENPGFQVTRALLGKEVDYRLEIPALGVDQPVKLLSGVEGPFFNWQSYIPKGKSAAIRKAVALQKLTKNSASFVRISGSLKATVPTKVLVERAEINGNICAEIDSGDVYGVIQAFPKIDEKIRSVAKQEANQKSLRQQVLRGCLELEKTERVDSFADLLKLKVKSEVTSAGFAAEVSRMAPTEKTIPLQYRSVVE